MKNMTILYMMIIFFYSDYYAYDSEDILGYPYGNNYFPIKIIEGNFKNSYCIQQFDKDLVNCTEAIHFISEGKEKYNCTKCFRGNILSQINTTGIYICKYDGTNDTDEVRNSTSPVTPSNGTTPIPTPTPSPSDGTTPTPTPSNGTTPTPSPSNGTTPAPSPSNGTTPSPTPTPTPSNGTTPSPTQTPTSSDETIPTPSPSNGSTPSPTPTPTSSDGTTPGGSDGGNIGDVGVIEHCQTYDPNNNYFCQSCDSSDYEVNQYTGSCVEKPEVPPALDWKDFYGFKKSSTKTINGRVIQGPSFTLRGITSNQVSARHAFVVYLIFIFSGRLRNLEETNPCHLRK